MKDRPVDIFEKLIWAQSAEDQARLIKQAWLEDNDEFFVGVDLACGPQTFGLDKVPEIQGDDDGERTLTFEEFHEMAQLLASGKLVGESAKKAVNQAAMTANLKEWNMWYRRILLKTLPKYLPLQVIRATLLELTSG